MSPHDRATFDPVDTALGGWHIAQLAIGVLGVLVISGEYSTGMIRSTFGAVPKRLPVLWAKAGVFCAVVFALMLPSAFMAFFVTQAILEAAPRADDDRRAARAARGRRRARSS